MSILSKLFPAYEVKVTIREIDVFLEKYRLLCNDIIRPDAVALARVTDATIHSIRIDDWKPEHLALIILTNVLDRHISSGQYHTYRGVLSIIGTDMLKLWSMAVTRLKERSYYSEDEAKKDMEYIHDQVKSIG